MNTKTHISGLFIIGILVISCCTKKAIVDETDTKTTTTEKKTTFDAKRYTVGTITYSEKEDKCDYTILTKDNIYYDPVNLKEKFKKNELIVYFKFTSLRMMNRCKKARPIKINEMIVNLE